MIEEPGWRAALASSGVSDVAAAAATLRSGDAVVYPPADQVFAAFELSPLAQTRVVIVGQDPYHGAGQAMGLAFSVPRGVRIPPSLRNIYKELVAEDIGFVDPGHGDLTAWAARGCLLLNSALSVFEGKAGSHAAHWKPFTAQVLSVLAGVSDRRLVVLLWGAHAQKLGAVFAGSSHHVLESAHPSPLSARNGFFGNGHFARTDELLRGDGGLGFDWSLPAL